MKVTYNFNPIHSTLITCFFILVSFITTACQVDKQSIHQKVDKSQVSPDILNLSLRMKDLEGNPVKLINGAFQGNHLSIKVIQTATADLNRDGLLDCAIIIFENYGGSGNFRKLYLLINNGKEIIHTDEKFIGDRIKITNLNISKGTIIVEYLDRDIDESFAVVPHIKKSVKYYVNEMKLERLPSDQY